MRIDRGALIDFFEGDVNTGPYQAAIKGIAGEELGLALLVKFLSDQGRNPTRVLGTPHPAGRAGHYLDGWVRAQADDHDRLMTLYQVEVKLWGKYSVLHQGRPPQDAHPLVQPPDNAPADDHRAYKVQQRWYQYWDERGFQDEELRKVLDGNMALPMLEPHEDNARVDPLACLWDAVHPHGERTPWFSVPLPEFPEEAQRPWVANHRRFTRVWVFSMSAFLSTLEGTLEDRELLLPLPETCERLQWLKRIFPHG
jgi:hypothetical protein